MLRKIPRSLAVLIAVALVEAVTWICFLPPLQGPDEAGHFAYTQKVVETRSIPWRAVGGAPPGGTRPLSTELETALYAAAIPPSWGNPSGRPAATSKDERLWDERRSGLDRGDGGYTSSMANPPLYYLYAAAPYVIAHPASVFDRAFLMRLANLPLLVVLVVFCWLVAGELLGRRQWLQTLATAAVVLQPQVIHMTAVVSPDIGLAAIWAAALYVMIRLVEAGPSRSRLAWLVALVAASSLIQPRGLALVIPALAAIALALRRHQPRVSPRLGAALLGSAYVASAVALVVYATASDPDGSRIRRFASYVWQFYLPRLDFMTPTISPGYGVRQAYVDRFFGGFAQLEVELPDHVLTVVVVAALALVVLAVVGVVVRRRAIRRRLGVVVVCALMVVGYLALLHAVAFRSLLGGPNPVITGRYLLPLVALYGTGIAFAVSWMRRDAAVALGAVVLAGLTWLQLESFGVLFERFYA